MISILGFLSLNMIISYIFCKRQLATLPHTTGVYIIILYILAFFKALSYIDFFSLLFVILCSALFIGKRITFGTYNYHDLIIIGIVFSVIFFFCRNRRVFNFDELGVWALETKSLLIHEGFAPKYQNLTVEYGDYNQGLMLFMWWLCHMFPTQASEGMMYVGYWSLFAIFILPAFSADRSIIKAFIESIFLSFIIFFVPSVVNAQNYSCITVELPMSSCFAYTLWSCFYRYNEIQVNNLENAYKVSTLAIGLSILVMMKSSGIAFSFGLIVLFGITNKIKKRNFLYYFSICSPSILISMSWKTYCNFMERTSGLRQSLRNSIMSITGGSISEITDMRNVRLYILSFVKAFLKEPLHQQSDAIVNITPIGFVSIVIVFLFIIYYLKYIDKIRLQTLLCFYIFSVGIFSLTLLFLHIYMFNEPGYFQSNFMVLTIARYGEPLFLGVLIAIIMLLASHLSKNDNLTINIAEIFICIFLFIFGRPSEIKDNIIDPSNNNLIAQEKTTEVLTENEEFFSMEQKNRVLFLSNSLNDTDINSYWDLRWIQYLSAPQSVILAMCTPDEREITMSEYKEKYHYDYCYQSGFNITVS